jgi:ribonuclease HI
MELITIFVAGRSAGAPGAAGIGVCIKDTSGTCVREISQAIGNAYEDYAAYYAVMVALNNLKETYGDKTKEYKFEIKLDDELVEGQLNSKRVIKEPGLVPLFIEIHNQRITDFPKLKFTLISKSENAEAEKLAKEAIS